MWTPTLLRQEPILWPLLILLSIIYIIPHTPIPDKVYGKIQVWRHSLPKVVVDLHPTKTYRNRFSTNRTVLYMETRAEVKHAVPLLLHMTKVIPPEWRFVFLGSETLVKQVSQSATVTSMIARGKLRLGSIERWTDKWKDSPDIHETHSRLLTNLSFYEEQFPKVEWLLNFRSSAIVCANANRTVDDYLDYDWVGAPWREDDKFGGSGGLSLRRLSKVKEVLKFQARTDHSESEDRWMSKRIGLLPRSKAANAQIEKGFAVEDVWSERPLGYHINPALSPGVSPQVWGTLENRQKIFDYCPEVKMILNMRLERERCPPEQPKQPVPQYQAPPPATPEHEDLPPDIEQALHQGY